MVQFIGKTVNGKVFKCDKCTAIHLEFKNLNFNFSEKQFLYFVKTIQELDGNEWEERNKHSVYSRKIMIPIGHKNFTILLNNQELNELNDLITTGTNTKPAFRNVLAGNFSMPLFYN
jgi:hypothetical protein